MTDYLKQWMDEHPGQPIPDSEDFTEEDEQRLDAIWDAMPRDEEVLRMQELCRQELEGETLDDSST